MAPVPSPGRDSVVDPTGQAIATYGTFACAAVAIVLALVVPSLHKAGELIGREESVVALTGRVAAGGGVVGLIFAGIVFLMVYQPGK